MFAGSQLRGLKPRRLPCHTEPIDIGELRRNVLAVFLGGLEARLLHRFEGLFIKASARAFHDFRPRYFAFCIHFDSDRHIAFHTHTQSQRGISGPNRLYRLRFAIGFQDHRLRWKTGRVGTSSQTRYRGTAASAGTSWSWNNPNVTFAKKTSGPRFAATRFKSRTRRRPRFGFRLLLNRR